MKNNLRNLKRIPEEAWLGGVCAGLAYNFKFPLWLMRLGWMFIFFITMIWPTFILYLLLWIFMPSMDKTPEDFNKAVN